MFAGFMMNAWTTATIVAVVAGVVGYFVVLRGSAFPAHAIPKGAFAGAAGASLLGINTLIGLAVFSLLGALGIGTLGRRGRQDVVTALALVVMLALGAAFLSRTTQYEPELYSLLFGEILGVSTTQILPIAALGALCITAIAVLYRPLTLSSTVPEIAEAKGIRGYRIQIAFLIVVALATTMTVPVTGALLIFSLMIGPPAAARSLTSRPLLAMALSVAIALVTVWAAIAASYLYNWPIGFFVGALAALSYGLGRGWAAWRRTRTMPLAAPHAGPGLPGTHKSARGAAHAEFPVCRSWVATARRGSHGRGFGRRVDRHPAHAGTLGNRSSRTSPGAAATRSGNGLGSNSRSFAWPANRTVAPNAYGRKGHRGLAR